MATTIKSHICPSSYTQFIFVFGKEKKREKKTLATKRHIVFLRVLDIYHLSFSITNNFVRERLHRLRLKYIGLCHETGKKRL